LVRVRGRVGVRAKVRARARVRARVRARARGSCHLVALLGAAGDAAHGTRTAGGSGEGRQALPRAW